MTVEVLIGLCCLRLRPGGIGLLLVASRLETESAIAQSNDTARRSSSTNSRTTLEQPGILVEARSLVLETGPNQEFRKVDVAVVEDHLDRGAIMFWVAHATNERQDLFRRNEHGPHSCPVPPASTLICTALNGCRMRARRGCHRCPSSTEPVEALRRWLAMRLSGFPRARRAAAVSSICLTLPLCPNDRPLDGAGQSAPDHRSPLGGVFCPSRWNL